MEKIDQKSRAQTGLVHLLILPIAVVLLIAGFFFWKASDMQLVDEVKNKASEKMDFSAQNPTPTTPPGQNPYGLETFEFQEITIPHLRTREYESKLDGMDEISSNTSYTSYLASYDSDGYKINGLLTVPKTTRIGEKFPAVVFIHGYIPPAEYKTAVNYASYVDSLAKNGFVVFKTDLRGHADSEGEAGGAYYSDDYVVDTLNAVSALKSTDFVDAEKIGLWGHSMGGNVVFRSFVASKNIPAIVIWAGAGYTYTDLQEYMIQDTSYRPAPTGTQRSRDRQRLRDTYGTFDPEHWFWEQVPATNYLDVVEGALQINHAVDDNVVSIDYSRNLMEILESTNIIHELNEYPNGAHNITGNSYTQAMQETVDFFVRHLGMV